jgi:hypothetical protein
MRTSAGKTIFRRVRSPRASAFPGIVLRIEFTAFARGLSLLAGIVVLVKPRTAASAFSMITRRARTGYDIEMRLMLQTNARNVRKLDSFMVLIFVVFTESRKELRIHFFRRDRVRIAEDYHLDTRFLFAPLAKASHHSECSAASNFGRKCGGSPSRREWP